MLFSKLSEGIVVAAKQAAKPLTDSLAEAASHAMPTDEEKDEEKRRHRHSQHHRRRHKHKKEFEIDGDDLSPGDELGWLEAAPRLSKAPVPARTTSDNALERAKNTLESLGHHSADMAPVGRQIYHEQLANAQLALSATRDELERVVREKTEEIARA